MSDEQFIQQLKMEGFTYQEFINKYQKSLMTSVTKKIRRVFTFPQQRFYHNMCLLGYFSSNNNVLLSVNFVNFIDKNVDGVVTSEALMTPKVKKWFVDNMSRYLDHIKFIRTGPKHSQIVEYNDGISFING